MNQPTKITRRTLRAQDATLNEDEETTETAALNSVELKEDAKGSVRVESYKVYANDPQEAERRALEGMMRLRSRIAEAADQKMGQQLEASVKGLKP